MRILATPELKEWTAWDTWEQAWIMACEIIPNKLETWQITEATWEKLKKDYPNATRIITDSQKLLNEKLNELKSHWEQFSL